MQEKSQECSYKEHISSRRHCRIKQKIQNINTKNGGSIMCYLVAKDRYAHGCFALKTTHGKHLAELKSELDQAVGYKGVQLVTISRPTAYGEYAPYHFVDTEQEFRSLVKGLRP